jgi:hypothetical protein
MNFSEYARFEVITVMNIQVMVFGLLCCGVMCWDTISVDLGASIFRTKWGLEVDTYTLGNTGGG